MKTRLFKKTLLLLITAFSISYPLSSCAFFDTNSGTQIKDVVTNYDTTTGNTIVTISFTNEDTTPVSFTIPQGISGKDGVSIKNISSNLSSDGNSVILTISYSDASIKDTIISVPVVQSKRIKEVLVDKDTNNNPTIQFVYTDNTKSEVITLPSGKDGNGINSFQVSDPDSSGNMTVIIEFSDGTSKTFEIKNGKDGVSIMNITYNEEKSDATTYVLTITYSDGYSEDISLARPTTNKWYVGTTSPEDDQDASSNSITGDFYLNKLTGSVYQKESNGQWAYLFSMKSESSQEEKVYHTIYFYPQEGKINNQSGTLMYNIEEGKTMSLSLIPTPVLENHTFVGWYTDLNNVNSGKFTDLTPVMEDLKLYAKYEKTQG